MSMFRARVVNGRIHLDEPVDLPDGTVVDLITPDEGDRDLFVHHTGIEMEGYRSLAEGLRVSYEEEQGDKGPKAVNVQKL